MPKCEDGKFREGWVMYSDPKASTCTLCGDNIRSEARDLDENPLAPNGTLVRATSTSCCEYPLLLLLPACSVVTSLVPACLATRPDLASHAAVLSCFQLQQQGVWYP